MNSEFSNNRAPHILNTSSNLLGFSFLVLTSTRLINPQDVQIITKIAATCVALFALSTLLSYIAIHSKTHNRTIRYEEAASYIFLFGQLVLTVGAILLSINYIT